MSVIRMAAVSILLFTACERAEQDPRTLPPAVRTTTVIAGTPASLAFTGTVRARIESDLGFRVPGKIHERLVDAGSEVKANQVLMRLDVTDLDLAVQAAASTAEAARAQAVYQVAEEKRLKALLALHAVSVQEYEASQAAAAAALARADAAEAQARQAVNQSKYSDLMADSDGVVLAVLGEPGQVVAAGQPVIRFAQAGPREAVVAIPENKRDSTVGTARANLYGKVGDDEPATLRQLSASADPRSRTYEARYVLSGLQADAPLGSTVTVTLTPAGSHSLLAVPMSALIDTGAGPGLWVLDEASSTVSFFPVTIASLGNEMVQLSRGPAIGTRIVSMGTHRLRIGQQVRPLGTTP